MRHLLLALLLATAPASASSVVIWPIDPVIATGERATALWLENSGTDPVMLQVRAFAWSQETGEDRLADQDEIVASPPMVEVAPGARQLVRVIRRTIDPAAERSYRLFIDEVPTAAPDLAGPQAGARLAVRMRYSIPLFAHGAADGAPALDARTRLQDGTRVVEITNTGTRRARLTDLRLGAGETAPLIRAGLVGYVLPGATMRWPLPPEASGSVLTVAVDGVARTFTLAA